MILFYTQSRVRSEIEAVWGGGVSRPWQAGETRSSQCTREISQNQPSELSNASIVPQTSVADMIRSEDELNLNQEMQRELPRTRHSSVLLEHKKD